MTKTKSLRSRIIAQPVFKPNAPVSKTFRSLLLHRLKSAQITRPKNYSASIKSTIKNNILIDSEMNMPRAHKNKSVYPADLVCLSSSHTPATSYASEDNKLVVAQAQAALVGFDEINRLIKKLTLSFFAKKNDSSFFIKDGLFQGASFHIHCEQRELSLQAKYLSPDAHRIMNSHQDYLRSRLSQKKIILKNLSIAS